MRVQRCKFLPWRPLPATPPLANASAGHWDLGWLRVLERSTCGRAPMALSIPGGVQGRGIPIPGRWQHTWGPPCCGTAATLGGLQPCCRLAWINKQIRGFLGFSTEQHRWGDARGGGRRPWRDPRRRELPGAAVLPITARERGYRLRCKRRRAGARHPPPELPPVPLLPAAVPNSARPPRGSRDAPALSQSPARSIPWGGRCCLLGEFESLLLSNTPGMLSGSYGSSSASPGSDIHLGPLLLGSRLKNQGGSTMGIP